jgi:hypothetical protein
MMPKEEKKTESAPTTEKPSEPAPPPCYRCQKPSTGAARWLSADGNHSKAVASCDDCRAPFEATGNDVAQ